jgi:hypothetical protein
MKAGYNSPPVEFRGRSAPARLQRALELAERYGVDVPVMREIAG